MNLEANEQLLLSEGIIGWHKTLGLTNKRILFLDREIIERQVLLSDILEAYPKTQSFTGLTQLVIKHINGQTEIITFKTDDTNLLLGGLNYANSNATNMTNRYVNLINRVLTQKLNEPAGRQEEPKPKIINKHLLDMQAFLRSFYKSKYPLYPLQVLELDIKEKETSGKTREQIIEELYEEKSKSEKLT
jgi:hypothetical protein